MKSKTQTDDAILQSELIDKYLIHENESGLRASAKYYAEKGRPTGGLRLALYMMMVDYEKIRNEKITKEKIELKDTLSKCQYLLRQALDYVNLCLEFPNDDDSRNYNKMLRNNIVEFINQTK